jgi:hypothetical protein
MWATCPHSASSGYHAEFHESYHLKHTIPLNCRTSSSDTSVYHTDFHEVHSNVGEWQGCGMACELTWHITVGEQHVRGKGAVWYV